MGVGCMCKIFVAVHIRSCPVPIRHRMETQLPMSADASARSHAGGSPHVRQPNSHGPTGKATIDVKCSATWRASLSQERVE